MLTLIQLAVATALRQERVMRTALHDLALLEHKNLIGTGDRAQAVRNHKCRPASAQTAQTFLDQLLAFRIE